jgi:hypothetical protein
MSLLVSFKTTALQGMSMLKQEAVRSDSGGPFFLTLATGGMNGRPIAGNTKTKKQQQQKKKHMPDKNKTHVYYFKINK